MSDNEKRNLKLHLDKTYKLLKILDNSHIKGTTEFQIVYELEQINMKLNIEFND